MTEFLAATNSWLWVTANILTAYIVVINLFFCVFYMTQFPWRRYPLGRATLYRAAALEGLAVLIFIGIFVNPMTTQWWAYPGDIVEPWRPLVRFVIYGLVAAAVTNMTHLIWLRKFHPERSPDLSFVLEPRSERGDNVTPLARGSKPKG